MENRNLIYHYAAKLKDFSQKNHELNLIVEDQEENTFTIMISLFCNDIIRIRLGREISAPEYDFVNHDYLKPMDNVIVRNTGESLEVEHGGKTLVIGKNPFSFMINDVGGQVIYKENFNDVNSVGEGEDRIPPMGYTTDSFGNIISTNICAALRYDEHIYGLGERFTEFDKRGQRIVIKNTDTLGCRDATSYKNIPFYISSYGYGLFLNSHLISEFDIGCKSMASISINAPQNSLEYYILTGDSLKEILSHYIQFTGPAALPPDWSFGLWYSTGFKGNSRESTLNDAERIRREDIPCDVMHFDCYWLRDDMWCDFVWNEELYPDRVEMLNILKEQGYKICLWINPYVTIKTDMFREGTEKGYFVKQKDGSVYTDDLWHGLLSYCAIVDFTNSEAVKWYQKKVSDILSEGVDVLKTDFGEDIPFDCVFSNGKTGYEMRNIYSRLYNEYSPKLPFMDPINLPVSEPRYSYQHLMLNLSGENEQFSRTVRGSLTLSDIKYIEIITGPAGNGKSTFAVDGLMLVGESAGTGTGVSPVISKPGTQAYPSGIGENLQEDSNLTAPLSNPVTSTPGTLSAVTSKPDTSAWYGVDFGEARYVNTLEVYYLYEPNEQGDHVVVCPNSQTVQYWDGSSWKNVSNAVKRPSSPAANLNTITFDLVKTTKLRVVSVVPAGKAFSIYALRAFNTANLIGNAEGNTYPGRKASSSGSASPNLVSVTICASEKGETPTRNLPLNDLVVALYDVEGNHTVGAPLVKKIVPKGNVNLGGLTTIELPYSGLVPGKRYAIVLSQVETSGNGDQRNHYLWPTTNIPGITEYYGKMTNMDTGDSYHEALGTGWLIVTTDKGVIDLSPGAPKSGGFGVGHKDEVGRYQTFTVPMDDVYDTVDGSIDGGKGWSSEEFEGNVHWLEYETEKPKAVDTAVVYFDDAPAALPEKLTFEAFVEGEWVEVAELAGNEIELITEIFFDKVTTSKVRFTFEQADGTYFTVREAELLAVQEEEETPPVTYTIVVTSGGNGLAIANVNYAQQGDLVTVTATPDAGYTFKEWQVIRGDVTLSRINDNSAEFNMPAENVEIMAVFEEITSEFTVNVNAGSGGKVTLGTTQTSETSVTGSFNEGTYVSVTAIPLKGYRFKEWQVISGVTLTGEKYTQNPVTFMMPDNDVELKAVFEAIRNQPVNPSYPSTDKPKTLGTINEGQSSQAISASLKKGNNPVISLGNNIGSVKLAGKDLLEVTKAGKELIIVKGNNTISLTSEALKALGLSHESKVTLNLTPSSIPEETLQTLIKADPLNKELTKVSYKIGLTVDNKEILSSEALFKVTVDLSGMKLTEAQKNALTGIIFDEETGTYRQLGGEFNDDGTFTFYSPSAGEHSLIVSDNLKKVSLQIGQSEITVNNEKTDLDVAPVIRNDRTIVPLRAIAESLNAQVDWDSVTRTVTITLDGKTITLELGKSLPNNMGMAELINNRTFVPLRYIAEQLGANVLWDGETKVVTIYK